ncbi:hypothetical protein K402DRAFT_130674 [Aulographum hederae CBS 113979]|uniref:Uncharacterized protein n=1 Tax=Aulographum hederae CBS 113979 TaxID=1176131 RepID=A0A6G1HEQ0_9PEZI|nr:hypothetical protein K402DRAFT_130674 [Aulographum hederae CBS 113979]
MREQRQIARPYQMAGWPNSREDRAEREWCSGAEHRWPPKKDPQAEPGRAGVRRPGEAKCKRGVGESTARYEQVSRTDHCTSPHFTPFHSISLHQDDVSTAPLEAHPSPRRPSKTARLGRRNCCISESDRAQAFASSSALAVSCSDLCTTPHLIWHSTCRGVTETARLLHQICSIADRPTPASAFLTSCSVNSPLGATFHITLQMPPPA